MLYTYHLTLLRVQLYRFAWDCRDEGCFCESCSWTNLLLLHNINKAWVAFHIISLIFNGECAGQLGWLYLKLWVSGFGLPVSIQSLGYRGNSYLGHIHFIEEFDSTSRLSKNVVQLLSCCNPMDCSMPGFFVLHYLLEFPQIHVHWVDNSIQPFHPLSSPSPPALSLSQHQGHFQWVGSLHQVVKVLELWCQSFQWMVVV